MLLLERRYWVDGSLGLGWLGNYAILCVGYFVIIPACRLAA